MIYEVGTESKALTENGTPLYYGRYIVNANTITEAIEKTLARDLSQQVTEVWTLAKYQNIIE